MSAHGNSGYAGNIAQKRKKVSGETDSRMGMPEKRKEKQ